jgi:hypothetical protein
VTPYRFILVVSIECTSANYTKAWNTVIERFDKCLIANSHIRGIFDLPKATKNSVSTLRTLLNEFSQHHDFLDVLNIPNMHDLLLVSILSQKVDIETMKKFELQRGDEEFPTVNSFKKYLNNKCRALETISRGDLLSNNKDQKRPVSCVTNDKSNANQNYLKCLYCKEPHPLYKCFNFKKLNVSDRRSFVNKSQLCFFCLSTKHKVDKCNSSYRGCNRCSLKHHKLLHVNCDKPKLPSLTTCVGQSSKTTTNGVERNSKDSADPEYNCHNTIANYDRDIVLLSTALIHVLDPNGFRFPCRVLLDNASERNFITSEFLRSMNVSGYKSKWKISGVGGK